MKKYKIELTDEQLDCVTGALKIWADELLENKVEDIREGGRKLKKTLNSIARQMVKEGAVESTTIFKKELEKKFPKI